MPLNSLVGQAGLKIGPLVFETLIKHYFERILKEGGKGVTKLSQDELLYDEAFHIIKTFLEASTKHTIEDLQQFSNTRTPSPPWTHVVRLLVPMSSCDEAATYLIQALGGEEMTKRVAGGTKWWQVRGVRGIDAEWITAKKDWEEAKRKRKMHQKAKSGDASQPRPATNAGDQGQEPPAVYEPEMDEMACILFAHGGGYYFGSIDQERYSIERYARKINGRVFAINYRLAPQYPFPCPIHDFLAAYLFLIRPPEGASHSPVDPAKIVVAGDSAGGGLCIALLQIIRDTGLPMPAGGVLISPWCDLTHSFPSIHTNTATDVLPPYGLSFHRPSTLWPPPPAEVTTEVQNSIRSRVREALQINKGSEPGSPGFASRTVEEHATAGVGHEFVVSPTGQTLHLGSTASLPTPPPSGGVRDQTITLRTKSGEVLEIDQQIQMYAPNYLLTHPLITPIVSYLGGLPPLLVIASEKEVLRDEIIYFAYKAAHPDKHPVQEAARKMYPALEGIEKRFGPTRVHLQVYDDAAHTLPTLFSFTTPAKYCYRAIAIFCKYATGMFPSPADSSRFADDIQYALSPATSSPDLPPTSPSSDDRLGRSSLMPPSLPSSPTISESQTERPSTSGRNRHRNETIRSSKGTMRRAVSVSISHASGFFHRIRGRSPQSTSRVREASDVSDVAGPHFGDTSPGQEENVRKAGEPSVYEHGLDEMICERISTRGVIRPLEPEEELPAMQFPEELIGELSELVVRRYFDGREKFGPKFAKVSKSIEKQRRRNLDRVHNHTMRRMAQLQTYLAKEEPGQNGDETKESEPTPNGIQEGLMGTSSWPLAWALDIDESPPPSSIVARRDTEEARRLARIADRAFFVDESTISGNNLWSLLVDFLAKTPDKHGHKHKHKHGEGSAHQDGHADHSDAESKQERNRSRFARFVAERRKGPDASQYTDKQ